jgi:hypothetical protein
MGIVWKLLMKSDPPSHALSKEEATKGSGEESVPIDATEFCGAQRKGRDVREPTEDGTEQVSVAQELFEGL